MNFTGCRYGVSRCARLQFGLSSAGSETMMAPVLVLCVVSCAFRLSRRLGCTFAPVLFSWVVPAYLSLSLQHTAADGKQQLSASCTVADGVC